MTPTAARVSLHSIHLLTFMLLLVSGLLLFVPGLRAAMIGGYSLLIREMHRWGGVAFFVLPVLLVIGCGPRNIFTPPAVRTLRTLWQGAHVAISIGLSVIFTVTGFVLWGKQSFSEELVDGSRTLHDGLTYVAAGLVVFHLIEIGVAAAVARVGAAGANSR